MLLQVRKDKYINELFAVIGKESSRLYTCYSLTNKEYYSETKRDIVRYSKPIMNKDIEFILSCEGFNDVKFVKSINQIK